MTSLYRPPISSKRSGGTGFRVLATAVTLAAVAGAVGCSGQRGDASAASIAAQPAPVSVDVVPVVSRQLNMTISLPGELRPYEEVRIFPKISGFVKWIGVDRGSVVKKGQLLAVLTAPEIDAQKSEAQAKVLSAENQRVAAEAKLAADQGTYQRLQEASKTPGVISDQELEIAQKAAAGDQARVVALRNMADAARENLRSATEMERYLRISAPFDGVVTRRNVHPGALVGPGGSSSMLRIEQVAHLRLVVAVPEAYVASVEKGAKVSFTVPAFPGRTFTGSVARLADSMDVATRTMPTEMDVWNTTGELHSGMYPSVEWPVRRSKPTLFVPQSAVVRNMEQAYVYRIRNGQAEQVPVKTGGSEGDLAEVFGPLQAGDLIALRASEDLRSGTPVSAHRVMLETH